MKAFRILALFALCALSAQAQKAYQLASPDGKLKTTVNSGDTEAIKADTEALEKAFYAISEKLYQAQGGAQQDPNMGANPGNDQQNGGYYDADFEDKGN